jgi:predicted transcriptional regulator
VEEERVSRSMVADLAERLFGGSVTALVSHLLDECDVEPAELARLKSLIAQKEKERNRGRK